MCSSIKGAQQVEKDCNVAVKCELLLDPVDTSFNPFLKTLLDGGWKAIRKVLIGKLDPLKTKCVYYGVKYLGKSKANDISYMAYGHYASQRSIEDQQWKTHVYRVKLHVMHKEARYS